jgi:hypothetical protein
LLALYAAFFASFLPRAPYDSALQSEQVQFAERYLSLVVQRNWDAVQAVTDRQIWTHEGQQGLITVAEVFPKGDPGAIHLVGLNTTTTSGVETSNLTLEYLFPERPFLANFVLQRDGGTFILQGIHVQQIVAPLEEHYAFHFLGQRPMNYVVFAAAVLLILFHAYALARCILMPGLRRKWLWIVFILVGFGSVNYGWTDGTWSYAILSVYVPSVRLSQLAMQSFFVTFSVPLGAIVFMIRRKALAGPGPAQVFD